MGQCKCLGAKCNMRKLAVLSECSRYSVLDKFCEAQHYQFLASSKKIKNKKNENISCKYSAGFAAAGLQTAFLPPNNSLFH